MTSINDCIFGPLLKSVFLILLFNLFDCVLAQRTLLAAEIKLVQTNRFDNQSNGPAVEHDDNYLNGNNLADEGSVICNLRLDGAIEKGDLDRLKALVGETGDHYPRLCLNSRGGSYEEGLHIASFLLEKGMGTAIEAGSECLSSCALIFMAGSTIYGIYAGTINRFLHIRGRLGFHATYLLALPNKKYSKEEMAFANQVAIRAVAKFMKLANRGREAKFFPRELITKMLERGPNETFDVDTVGKAIRYRIHLYGGRAPSYLSDKALGNSCVNHYYGALESYSGLHRGDKPQRVKLPQGQRVTFELGAPRGGDCVIDIKTSGATVKSWRLQVGFDEPQWGSGRGFPYWYLVPPDTEIRKLSGGVQGLAQQDKHPTIPKTIQQRIERFIKWKHLQMGASQIKINPRNFARYVEYYGKRVSRKRVVSGKRKYFRKWTVARYSLADNSLKISAAEKPGVYDVQFEYDFHVSNSRKSVTGRGSARMRLLVTGKNIRILREDGKVLEKW